MAKLTVEEELDVAFKLAAKEADSGPTRQSSREAATEFYRSERKLIAPFAEDWIIDKIASVLSKERTKLRRERDRQYSLVGFKPPRRFVLPSGEKEEWGKATLHALKQGRAVVWQQHKDYKHPAVQKFDKAIAFMENAPRQHGLTWNEVIEKAK